MSDVSAPPEEGAAIAGSTTLVHRDILAFQWSRTPKAFAIMAPSMVLVFSAIWWATMTQEEWTYALGHLQWGLSFWFERAGWASIGLLALLAMLIPFMGWLGLRRMPQPNRDLRFTATADMFSTGDSAGASISIPWKLVRRVQVTERLLILQLVTRGWRYAPLRAFAPGDRAQVIAWARAGALAGK